MLKDRLDKYFKESLESNPQWDKDALWNDIESEMDAPKRRRRLVVWFIIGIALFGFLVGISIYNQQANKKLKLKESVALTTDLEKPNSQNIIEDKVDDSDVVVFETKEDQMFKNDTAETISNDKNDEPVSLQNKSSQNINANITIEELDHSEITDQKQNAGISNTLVVDILNNRLEPIANHVTELDFLPGLGIENLVNKYPPDELNLVFVDLAKRNEVVDEHYDWHQLSFFAGLGLANKRLNSNMESSSSMVSARVANEKTLEKRYLGFLFRKGIIKNWHLTSGLHYGEQHERMNIAYTDQIIESRKKMDAYVFTDVSGMSNFIEGEVDVNISQDFNIQHYNVLRSFDIPLLIGYHVQKNRLGIILEAGPSFNINQNFSGRIFDHENRELDAEDIYKKRVGLKGQIRAVMQYSILDGLHLNSGFMYSRQFDSSVYNSQNYSLSYSDLSFNIGASIQF